MTSNTTIRLNPIVIVATLLAAAGSSNGVYNGPQAVATAAAGTAITTSSIGVVPCAADDALHYDSINLATTTTGNVCCCVCKIDPIFATTNIAS
jgi:hypothetical protein